MSNTGPGGAGGGGGSSGGGAGGGFNLVGGNNGSPPVNFTSSERTALHVSSQIAAVLSLIGTLTIISVCVRFRRTGLLRNNFAVKLLFMLSVVDFIGSIQFFFPQSWCTAQAIIGEFTFLSSALWILCFAIHQHRVTCHRELFPQKYEAYYHLLSWGFPSLAVIVCLSVGAFGDIGFWCWISRGYIQLQWYFFYLPVIGVMCTLIGVFISIHLYIQSQTSGEEQQLRSLEMTVYLLVFFVIQLPGFVNRIYDAMFPTQPEKFSLALLNAFFLPLQGFANCLIFLRSRAVKRHIRAFGKKATKLDRILFEDRGMRDWTTTITDEKLELGGTLREIISKAPRYNSAVYSQGYHIFVSTWNLHGQNLGASQVADWIPLTFKPVVDEEIHEMKVVEDLRYHVVAIGVQECVQPNWYEFISERLAQVEEDSFTLLGVESVGAIKLAVWARRSVDVFSLSIEKTYEATGFANVLKNKGGVCISFKLGKLSFAFVNCHLAAHRKGKYAVQRNRNITQLVNRLVWDQEDLAGGNEVDLTSRHHCLFFFGDLNYRISEDIRKPDALQMLSDKDFPSLFQSDQLKRFRDERVILYGFKEATPLFAPSYKFVKGTTDYSTKRLPGWCDRILYKHRDLIAVHQHFYDTSNILFSDHLPVSSVFSVAVTPQVDLSTPSAQNNEWCIEMLEIQVLDAVSPDGVPPAEIFITFFGDCLGPYVQKTEKIRAIQVNEPIFVLNSGSIPKMNAFGKYNMRAELELVCLFLVVRDCELFGEDDVIGHSVVELFDKFCNHEEIVSFKVPLTRSTRWTGTLTGKMRVFNKRERR
eukprot:TRINITY_DN19747_c0_g1_i1.p1 TRINITY_DN19747_c0_g1~~TRINITY_DN19747_c0_g1_i1.p1  ORF type:complete len:813 (+),score=179.31 TRINITY_DN19747_c0_g1_i1:14-2452(+)